MLPAVSLFIIAQVSAKVKLFFRFFGNLENKASINKLTNINHQPSPEDKNRYVEERATGKTESSDFIRLKDLVIAGHVWLDRQTNGTMDNFKFDEQRKRNF